MVIVITNISLVILYVMLICTEYFDLLKTDTIYDWWYGQKIGWNRGILVAYEI